ncbi:Protein ssh4 [Tieghemiomyces parasiticus]|uniref:Protein ssh4 n=1 Tax=Tieghemiomyces parasiticus TaxID=78921 RepID=A0A9W8AJA8_9FUNG|nr:Protein ssh4 [Tieghemiomyces parasiticus]
MPLFSFSRHGQDDGHRHNYQAPNGGLPTYNQAAACPEPNYAFSPTKNASVDKFELGRTFQRQFPPERHLINLAPQDMARLQDHGLATHQFVFPPLFGRRNTPTEMYDYGQGPNNVIFTSPTSFRFQYELDSCVQTDLPLPSTILDHYELDSYEVTIRSKAANTVVAVGLATRPYPPFRLPGWNAESVGYHSDDGRKYYNDPEGGRDYGPPFGQGDTIAVQYCKSPGQVVFYKNQQPLGIAFSNIRAPLFPTVGADGPCELSVRFFPSQRSPDNAGPAPAYQPTAGFPQRDNNNLPPPAYTS